MKKVREIIDDFVGSLTKLLKISKCPNCEKVELPEKMKALPCYFNGGLIVLLFCSECFDSPERLNGKAIANKMKNTYPDHVCAIITAVNNFKKGFILKEIMFSGE